MILFAFVLGCLAGSLVTQNWARVRGALGAARAVIVGDPPAPAATISEVEAPKKPSLTLAKVSANLGEFFAWCWQNKTLILFVAAALLILSVMRGCGDSFGWGKSREQSRLEAQLARAETHTQELINERDGAIARADRADALRQQQIRAQSDQGHEDIAAATPDDEAPMDAGLSAAWAHAIDGLCLYPDADGDLPAACAGGATG